MINRKFYRNKVVRFQLYFIKEQCSVYSVIYTGKEMMKHETFASTERNVTTSLCLYSKWPIVGRQFRIQYLVAKMKRV